MTVENQEFEERMEGVSQEVVPESAEFPFSLLRESLEDKFYQADRALKSIFNSVAKEAPAFVAMFQTPENGVRYVVDASESMIDALERGQIKLTTNKVGETFAQLRDEKGRFGSKIPIKREKFSEGSDSAQLANVLQMRAVQSQLHAMADQIQDIDRNVQDVLVGQQNDRIGVYQSGLSLYLEARQVSDPDLKASLVGQSLRSLSESSFQLILALQSDVQYLADRDYEKSKAKREKLIDGKMNAINQSFAVIHQASILRAAIYCEQNELAAMSTVLTGYSRFIEKNIVANANLLAQCDDTDDGTQAGIWNRRANFELDASDLTTLIAAPTKAVYLNATVGEEE